MDHRITIRFEISIFAANTWRRLNPSVAESLSDMEFYEYAKPYYDSSDESCYFLDRISFVPIKNWPALRTNVFEPEECFEGGSSQHFYHCEVALAHIYQEAKKADDFAAEKLLASAEIILEQAAAGEISEWRRIRNVSQIIFSTIVQQQL